LEKNRITYYRQKNLLGVNSGIVFYGVGKSIQKKKSSLEIMYFGFQKDIKHILGKFIKRWFGSYKVQFYLPNNIVPLVTLYKFHPDLMLVNVNKLKPYQILDEKAQITYRLEPIYLEGQKDIEMDDKDKDPHDESIFVV